MEEARILWPMWARLGNGWTRAIVCLACSCLPAVGQAENVSTACPKELRVGLLETVTPPFLLLPTHEDAPPGGLFAEWVLTAARATQCNPRVKLLSLPRKRAYWLLEHGGVDFFLPAVPSITDLRQFAFPMKAGRPNGDWSFDITPASLWVRSDEEDVRWNGRVLKGPPGLEVGVAVGSSAEVLARSKGWKVSLGKSPSNGVDRLLHGRIRVILVADIVVEAFPPEVVSSLRRLHPPVARYEFLAPGNQAFVNNYPVLANEFWLGLCQAGKTYASKQGAATVASCR